ncbi:MAG: two-component system, OmpR family, sensor histidine kinase MtrB [Actinomycetota bacterium]|nr:two-component system, OmpR family, sensor histidine kinase MtrB [Actinomycetota bacterium]
MILVLGNFLLNRVESGLLDAKVQAALAEAATGAVTAQDAFDSADRTDPTVYETLVPDLVKRLATAGGPAGANEVALLRGPAVTAADAPLGVSSFEVSREAVPPVLRTGVRQSGKQLWTYGRLTRAGVSVPAITIGSPVVIPTVPGGYELYFVFPLDKEQATLALVRQTLAVAALGLVLLVGGIAWLVTRQVVTPVRMAARIAERLAAGRLEERMRVRGEDDLARLAASFNKMATSLQRQIRQLEDLSRVQRRFVSDVSHELRTPLTTVRMAADVLHEARSDFDPAVQRSAEILQAQLDRFEALLGDLLEISRHDAGAAVLEAEPTDLRQIAERVIEAAEPLAERRGSRVELIAPTSNCTADVDSRRVERVLRNLIVNAIEHGEGAPIEVHLAGDEAAVAVAVRDHGVGLSPGEAAMVFNRFWRADPARARTTGGTGLGLSIAIEDVHLHGGWLQAWGEPGDGSQFRLTLPRHQGTELSGSPIPLEPLDSRRRRRPVTVGEPYRRVVAAEPRETR